MWLDYPEIQNYSKLLQLLRILSATRSTEQLATLSEQIITTVTRMIKIQRLPQIDESIMNPFYHLLKHTTGLITTHFSSNEFSAYAQSYSLATTLTQLLSACQENTHCDVASLDQTFTMLGNLIGYLRHSSAYSIRCASLEAKLFSFLKGLQDTQLAANNEKGHTLFQSFLIAKNNTLPQSDFITNKQCHEKFGEHSGICLSSAKQRQQPVTEAIVQTQSPSKTSLAMVPSQTTLLSTQQTTPTTAFFTAQGQENETFFER